MRFSEFHELDKAFVVDIFFFFTEVSVVYFWCDDKVPKKINVIITAEFFFAFFDFSQLKK